MSCLYRIQMLTMLYSETPNVMLRKVIECGNGCAIVIDYSIFDEEFKKCYYNN